MASDNRDLGEDKTDKVEDARLVEEMRKRLDTMPFYESEPPIRYAPLSPKE